MSGCGRVEHQPLGRSSARPVPSQAEPSDVEPSASDGLPDDGVGGDSPAPLPVPSTAGFPDSTAVACAGKPSAAQVIAALRRDRDVLPAGVTPTATTGPLCSGTWQYTVLEMSGHEPLQVVS